MLKVSDNHSGFTLPELLIAATISGIAIIVAGFGLVSILNANERAEAENVRRMELNRALEYIADDIKMANSVTTATGYTVNPASPNCSKPSPIMRLTVPSGAATNTIVYYLNNINGCGKNASVWLKPGVIKRVENVNGTTIAGINGNELVDAIIAPASAPAGCTGTGGFYACINGRVVNLHLYGKLKGSVEPLKVETRVFTRSTFTPTPSP